MPDSEFEPREIPFEVPVMDLFVDDFLTDELVEELPGDLQGLYLLALVHEWRKRGRGLPSGVRLARLLNTGRRRFQTFKRTVLDVFFRELGGRLYNVRLETKLQAAAERRESRSDRSRGAAASRWGKYPDAPGIAPGTAWAMPSFTPKTSIPSGVPFWPPAEEEPESAGVVEILTSHPWTFGERKARRIASRGVSIEDLREWELYALREGRAAAAARIQQVKNPREIPPERAPRRRGGSDAAQARALQELGEIISKQPTTKDAPTDENLKA